jgi:long-chain acyl-CoA synthetase
MITHESARESLVGGDDLSFLRTLVDHAAQRPDQVALIDELGSVTYAELWARVAQQAGALESAGLQPGDRVALVAENSIAFLVSSFAIWQVGGILVTIYPSSAASDLAFCLESSDPVLVLVDRHTVQAVRTVKTGKVPIVEINEQIVVPPITRLAGTMASATGPESSALRLICYTSGSTARPKAVMVSSAAIDNGAVTYAEIWGLGPDDVTVACLPMAWLYGLNTTSMAVLVGGGTVVILRRARPELIVEAAVGHAATFLAGVTTMFAKLVNYLDSLDQSPDLSSLRLCVSGGEPRNESAFDRWRRYAGIPVHDTYSASECFPLVSYDPLEDPEPVFGSAGRLVPRSELRVVDLDGKDVVAGQVGEAWSRGPGLMLGYWGDPAQTAAVLTDDGWYRTKDLVRVDERGYVHVVGRLSDMIIRGGANVSPTEVERVLRECSGVRDVAVVGLPDEIYGQRVVAAVVPADGQMIDAGAMTEHARGHLVSFKIPTEFVAMSELPQNSTTGKVDRRRIAELITERGA